MTQTESPELTVPAIAHVDTAELAPATSAVIVVDMQNDFAHPDGKLFCEDAPATFDVIRDLTTRARNAGAHVVYTQDWHEEDDPEFAIWGEHARAESWGAEIVGELTPEGGDTVIRKPRYDAFYATPLDHMLRTRGITHLVVTGTVANICVLRTAGSAAIRWYEVAVPEDAVSALTPFDKVAALRQVDFLFAGDVTTGAGVRFA